MLINGALSCWNMKNSSAMWRLHRRTHRMTDCTFPLPSGRKTLQWNICFARDPHSASRWWCRSVCQNWAALVWYSSSLESRWMEPTTVSAAATYAAGHTSCRRRRVHISLSAGQFSGAPVSWDDQSSWTRDSCFHLAGFVAAEQPRTQTHWLQNLEPDAATSLLDESADGRFEAGSD